MDAISHFTNDSIITKPNITSVYTKYFLSLSVSVVWYCKFYHIKFRFLFCLSLAEKNWDIQWRFQRRLYGKYDTLDRRSTTLHNNGIPLWCIHLVIGLFDHIELTVEILENSVISSKSYFELIIKPRIVSRICNTTLKL